MRRSSFAFSVALLTVATRALADESASATDASQEQPVVPPIVEPGAPTKREAAHQATPEATVTLHVSSPRVVTVEREDTGEVVCSSPCDRPVPAAARYRIGGARPSRPFTLDARGGAAKLTVAPASNREFWGGVAGLGVGGALLAGGVVALAVGYANQGTVPDAGGTITDTTYTDTMTLGAVLIVAGAAAGLWGGATALSNLRTTVQGGVLGDPPARGGARPARTAGVGPSWSPQRTFFVPILQGAF